MNVVEGSRCKMMQILRQVNVYMSIYYCICLFNNLHHDSVFMSVAYLFDLNKGTLLFFLQNTHTHTQAEVSLYLDIECHCRKISVTSLSHADEPFFFSSDLLQWFMQLSESLHTWQEERKAVPTKQVLYSIHIPLCSPLLIKL